MVPEDVIKEYMKRTDYFSDIDHIKKLKEILLPKMYTFMDHIQDFKDDNEKMRSMIREFDKTISLKASKYYV